MYYDVSCILFDHFFHSHSFFAWNKDHCFSAVVICDRHDRVVTVRLGKFGDCYARTLRNGTHAHCTDMGVWKAGSCSGTLDSDGPVHSEPLMEG